MSTVFDLPTHPACELLPPLSDAELDELKADITGNGQRDPIVVWTDTDGRRWLLDGRNRLEACRRAGIEPRIVEAGSEQVVDPFAFVLSKNVFRRNLNAAQQNAAIRARATPMPRSSRRSLPRAGYWFPFATRMHWCIDTATRPPGDTTPRPSGRCWISRIQCELTTAIPPWRKRGSSGGRRGVRVRGGSK